MKICKCTGYCLDTICTTSDSGLTVRRCWCADCKDTKKDIKANAYKITTGGN